MAGIIPNSVPSISSRDFVALLGREVFRPLDPRGQLGTEALLPISRKLCEEELGHRKEFLSHPNGTAGMEALLLRQGSQNSAIGSLSVSLKLILPPFWSAFLNIPTKKPGGSIETMQSCDFDGQQTSRLPSYSPLPLDVLVRAKLDVLKGVSLRHITSISSNLSFTIACQAFFLLLTVSRKEEPPDL